MHAESFTTPLAPAEEWTDRVAARLHSRIGGQLRDLRITIREDGPILQGRVGTNYCQQMAQELAMA